MHLDQAVLVCQRLAGRYDDLDEDGQSGHRFGEITGKVLRVPIVPPVPGA